jgi:hypothetical protein
MYGIWVIKENAPNEIKMTCNMRKKIWYKKLKIPPLKEYLYLRKQAGAEQGILKKYYPKGEDFFEIAERSLKCERLIS